MRTEGRDRLWAWFGFSYSSFQVMPRVLMHEMPDEWQDKMAELLEEAQEAFPGCPDRFTVRLLDGGGHMVKMPRWLKNYRHPSRDDIDAVRRKG